MNQGYPIAKERERKRSVNVDIWHALDLSSILILISLIWLLLYTSYARKRWWLITLTAPGSSWRYFSITQRSHSRSLRIFSSDLLLSFSFSLASFLLHFLLYVNTKNSSFSYRSEYVEQRANERFGATHTHTLNIPPFLSSLLSSHRRVCLTHWSKYIHRLNAIKIDSICTHVSLFPSLFNEHSEKKKEDYVEFYIGRCVRDDNEVWILLLFLSVSVSSKLHFRIASKSDLLLFYIRTEIIFLFFFFFFIFDMYTLLITTHMCSISLTGL